LLLTTAHGSTDEVVAFAVVVECAEEVAACVEGVVGRATMGLESPSQKIRESLIVDD
jgi:hypothetical protein